MLPEGWRPLLDGESLEIGDEVWMKKDYKWHTSKVGGDMPRTVEHPKTRTRRPLPTQVNAQPSPPMIRLRLPSEKPTREDGDKDGEIGTYGPEGINFCKWDSDISDVHFWLPGSLPDDILSREPTQEEKWQAEFEACFPDFDLTKQHGGGYLHAHAATAWRVFLAAKKGGAK